MHVAPPAIETLPREASLDPDDWEGTKRLGHRIVDELLEHQRTIGGRRAWTPAPEAVRASWRESLPVDGIGLDAAYEEFRETILPYGIGNAHPRFWGWVTGTGTAGGMLAELMAGGMNTLAAFGDQAATHVERQVLSWCAALLGMPDESTGVMVTGGSMANLTALLVARDAMLPGFLESGARALSVEPVVYASAQVHNSVDKALGYIGLGRSALRRVSVTSEYAIDVAALEQAIAEDRAAGRQPVCVIASAGTVNTGALDDLEAVAAIAARERIWFHVDAAFGATLAASPRYRDLLRGIERADSVAFDFHKWFCVPYATAAVLVRSPEAHRRPFVQAASYLAAMPRGVSGPAGIAFNEFGMDLSRDFRALKVWMTLKEHGIARFGELVEQNIAQARYLAGLVTAHPRLELTAPVAINVVTFRYVVPGRSPDELNAINREILLRIQESGEAVPSFTMLEGRFVLRAAIVNHRSTRADFERLARAAVQAGDDIVSSERNA